jgi:hypothetical protein
MNTSRRTSRLGQLLRLPAVTAFLAGVAVAGAHPAAAQTCMEDKVDAELRPLNCTANDVQLAGFLVVDGPGACVAGEPIEVTLKAALAAGAAERYDIGLFIALDGGEALTGQCLQDYLPPPLQPAPPTCTGTPNPDGGPYFNAECTEDPSDTCGDLDGGGGRGRRARRSRAVLNVRRYWLRRFWAISWKCGWRETGVPVPRE